MPGKFYGEEHFDPKFIVIQIVAVQAAYYALQGAFTLIFSNILGVRCHIAQVFSSAVYDSVNSYAMTGVFTLALTTLAMVGVFILVVERANKCFDFGFTCYVIHFALSWYWGGFPVQYMWWAVNGAAAAALVLVSEFVCMKIEQKEIKIAWLEEKQELPKD